MDPSGNPTMRLDSFAHRGSGDDRTELERTTVGLTILNARMNLGKYRIVDSLA
jgi:hypothetical protein